MVLKFKSKRERQSADDEKRKESLKRKLKEKDSQKKLIQSALSAIDGPPIGKKIKFKVEGNDDISSQNVGDAVGKQENSKISLFDHSDSENDEKQYEFEIKEQFEGKKGHKLLNLQSNYNNDERFKLDKRFQEDSSESDREDGDSQQEVGEEKAQQLKVLESVLGEPLRISKEKTVKKSKKGFFEMVRFDAKNIDHRREDVKPEPLKFKSKAKERREKRKREVIEDKKPQVSEEKFYKVSDSLRNALKDRQKENGNFSLLAAFSKISAKDESEEEEDLEEGKDEIEKLKDLEAELETCQSNVEPVKVQGIVNEKLFFTENDPRFEEGLKFINMKNSDEAREAMKSYDSVRGDIREVLRLRWQKHKQRRNPFKNKIGVKGKKKKDNFRKGNSSYSRKRF